MVTSPHVLASEAGVRILQTGGSAVDAAIAAAAVLAVVYPHMTSAGGDAFWLIYDARAGVVRSLEAAGRAAAVATIDWFSARGLREIPIRGVLPAVAAAAAAGFGTVVVPADNAPEAALVPGVRVLARLRVGVGGAGTEDVDP